MRSPEQYSSSVVVVWEIGSSTRRTRWRGVGKSAPNVDETPSHATTATAVFMFPRGPRRRGYLGRRRFTNGFTEGVIGKGKLLPSGLRGPAFAGPTVINDALTAAAPAAP